MGGPGSGKSIFGVQYLYKGATEYDEPGIYVTLEESPQKIRRNILPFGWDLQELEENRKIIIVDAVSHRITDMELDPEILKKGLDVENMIVNLESAIKDIGAKRLVLDSLSVMGMYSETDFDMRTKLLRLSGSLAAHDITTLVITEAQSADVGTTVFPPETFMFDGVLTLRLDTDSQERKISIRKMRGTKHVIGAYRFDITDDGIVVIPG